VLGYQYESADEQLKICFSYELVSQDYRLSSGEQDFIKSYLKRTIIAIHIERSWLAQSKGSKKR
jgi:hypothetical protein